jgi:hypothetical protein
MFGRLSRMTPNGALRCRYRVFFFFFYFPIAASLLGGNLGRAFEPGSGEPGVANDAGWPAGAWDDPVHEQPPKGGLSPVTEYAPGTGRGQGLGGLSAPILVLPGQRDARYERPYALCERHRALPEHGCVLEPPVTLRGWLVCTRACFVQPLPINRSQLIPQLLDTPA